MAGGDDTRRGSRALSRGRSANALELKNANQDEFQSVLFRSLKGRELIVHLLGKPPQFGDVVELRNPGPDGQDNIVKAEVVGLEKVTNDRDGIRVVLMLTIDAPDAIAKLFSTTPRSPRPKSKLSDSPLFLGFDDDEKKKREKKKKKKSSKKGESHVSSVPPSMTLGSQDSGELSWGWVARDEDAFRAGDIRATPVGDIDIDALSRALAVAHIGQGADIYTRASDAWSPLPEAIPEEDLYDAPPKSEEEETESIEVQFPESDNPPEVVVDSQEVSIDVAEPDIESLESPPPEDETPRKTGGNTPRIIDSSELPPSPEEERIRPSGREDSSEPPASKRPAPATSNAGRYSAVRPSVAEGYQEEVFQKKTPARASSSEDESLKSQRKPGRTTGGYLYTSEKPAGRHRRPRSSQRSPASEPEVERPLPKPTSSEIKRRSEEGQTPREKPRRSSPERGKGRRRGQTSRPKLVPTVAGLVEPPVVGIDLGASYSKIAAYHAGRVHLIEDKSSSLATRAAVPSTVAFTNEGEWIVGESAREMLWVDPSRVVVSSKRLLGLKHSDPQASGVLASIAVPSYPGPEDSIVFDADGEVATVVDVVSRIVLRLVEMASQWSGHEVTRAVMTVPVDFDEESVQELKGAARKAGVDIVAVISEPVSAAMGCGFKSEKEAIIAVVDFGGGTCDSSIIKVANDRFSILGSAGDRWLGGADLDEILAQFVAEEFFAESGVSFDGRPDLHQRLLCTSEESKRWLSTLESVDVILPRASMSEDGPVTLRVPVERSQFEEVIDGVVDASIKVCEDALNAAEIEPSEVDAVLMTGGTTRVPAIRRAVRDFFGKPGSFGVYPENAVVVGAAINAAMISGVEVPEGFVEKLREGEGRVSRQIGLAIADGSTEPVIEASQRPPVAAHRLFCTSQDNQTACRIELVEGGASETEGNTKLGGFIIDGLPPRKAGETKLDIYFELSSTGTLFVTAQDRSSGHRAQGIFDIPVE